MIKRNNFRIIQEPVFTASPLLGDRVGVLTVGVVSAAWTCVRAPLLSHAAQALSSHLVSERLSVVILSPTQESPKNVVISYKVSNLSPLLVLLVTWVVVACLLGEVGEHGGQSLPVDIISSLVSFVLSYLLN